MDLPLVFKQTEQTTKQILKNSKWQQVVCLRCTNIQYLSLNVLTLSQTITYKIANIKHLHSSIKNNFQLLLSKN